MAKLRATLLTGAVLAALSPLTALAGEIATEALLRSIGVERQEQAAFLDYCHCTTSTTPSLEEIVKNLHEGFRTAKNEEDIGDVSLYCAASIASHSFTERDKLNVQALGLLRAGHIDEANAALKRVRSLSDLDRNLAERTCRPDIQDEELIKLHQTR